MKDPYKSFPLYFVSEGGDIFQILLEPIPLAHLPIFRDFRFLYIHITPLKMTYEINNVCSCEQ